VTTLNFVAMRRCAVSLLLIACVSPLGTLAAQAPGVPAWRTRLVPWASHFGQDEPWIRDARLARYTTPGYPDDFQVLFANPDTAGGAKPEVMWVRTFAADSATGLYLGYLLNQPHWLRSVVPGDNVVFRADDAKGLPTAVGAPDFGTAGWPTESRAPEFLLVLRDGIRAYRAGNNGHHMPEIERCISVLAPAMAAAPAAASSDERFVGHFVLGRCLAEKYETDRAIEQFRAAIALDPNDLDSHMALLAEFSVMTHQLPGKLSPEEEARWEHEFVEQLRLVRARFASDKGLPQVLEMIFDPAQEAELLPVWKPHVERLRRVGYGVFRWKQR
jgi:hypothetical protein